MLSGVSLTNEKSYLIGKFARLALGTANLDYNGRYCMVSAGAGNKKALGIDRASNPWSDIPLADVVWTAGTNIAETFPITTSYIWRARDRGARLIVQDPRVVPHARTADLFLPVRPGTDSALFGAVLHELIRHDWLDHDFIDAHTNDFDQAAAAVADMTPGVGGGHHRRPRGAHRAGRRVVGDERDRDAAARRGIEQQSKGVDNVLAAINLGLATGKYGKPGCGSPPSPGRATARAAASTDTSATSSRATATSPTPSTARTSRRCGAATSTRSRARGSWRSRSSRRSTPGRSRGCCRSASTRWCRPGRELHPRGARRLEFYSVIDFFLSESAHHADIVLPGSLHEEDEGTSTRRGSDHQDQRGGRAAGRGAPDWEILVDIAERLGRGRYFPYTDTRQIFEELRSRRPVGPPTTRGATWERIEAEYGLFWPIPEEGTRARPACTRAAGSTTPTVEAKFHAVPYRLPGEVVDDDYPVWLTTGRVVSQYLSGTQTRRIARSSSSTPNRCARCTPVSPSGSVSPTATSSRSRRGGAR
jgi:assimilatory nitrate reductase catalytic subunit